jgi:hypothetical protein
MARLADPAAYWCRLAKKLADALTAEIGAGPCDERIKDCAGHAALAEFRRAWRAVKEEKDGPQST